LAAVPSIGRASRIEGDLAPEADATRALYEQYANQVFRYCLHQLGSREEAEDAVQSTFLNAFRGIKRGVVPDLEAAWLFKIAHNVCLSRRRSAWRRGRIESPADFDVIEELAPAPSRRADELIGLQDVLERLPETQRRAILLREWQGLSYREIAVELDLSQSAVETLIFRARRSLASGLEQPETKKRRVARALDWSNVLAGLKTALVGGSAAAKIAATVAVVSATTVVAAAPVQQHQRYQHHQAAIVATAHPATPAAAARHTVAAASAARARKHHLSVFSRQAVPVSIPAAHVTAPPATLDVSAPVGPPVAVQPEPATAPTPDVASPPPSPPSDQAPEREPSSSAPVSLPDTPTPAINLTVVDIPTPATQPVPPLAPPVQQPSLKVGNGGGNNG
jgi:RNA polymerase sigma factor (sigma-70 family)